MLFKKTSFSSVSYATWSHIILDYGDKWYSALLSFFWVFFFFTLFFCKFSSGFYFFVNFHLFSHVAVCLCRSHRSVRYCMFHIWCVLLCPPPALVPRFWCIHMLVSIWRLQSTRQQIFYPKKIHSFWHKQVIIGLLADFCFRWPTVG